MGKGPALLHGGGAVTEASAICCYLADAFPEAGLTVPVGAPRRGPYLKWLFFSSGCIEPAMTDIALQREAPPRAMAGYGDVDTMVADLAAALRRGPSPFGETHSAADVGYGAQLLAAWGLRLMHRADGTTLL